MTRLGWIRANASRQDEACFRGPFPGDWYQQAAIAADFGVTKGNIWAIAHGVSWGCTQ